MFNIAKKTKYGGQQRIIASSDYKCFVKKSASVDAIKVKLSQTNEPFRLGGRYHIETSPLICKANQYDIGLRRERVNG